MFEQLRKVDGRAILVKILSEPAPVVCFFIPTRIPTHTESSVLPTCPLKKSKGQPLPFLVKLEGQITPIKN